MLRVLMSPDVDLTHLARAGMQQKAAVRISLEKRTEEEVWEIDLAGLPLQKQADALVALLAAD